MTNEYVRIELSHHQIRLSKFLEEFLVVDYYDQHARDDASHREHSACLKRGDAAGDWIGRGSHRGVCVFSGVC